MLVKKNLKLKTENIISFFNIINITEKTENMLFFVIIFLNIGSLYLIYRQHQDFILFLKAPIIYIILLIMFVYIYLYKQTTKVLLGINYNGVIISKLFKFFIENIGKTINTIKQVSNPLNPLKKM